MATPGTVIGGRFRVDQLLGAGGMGVVVAATHLQLGHRVAIKLLRDDKLGEPTLIQRFLREARSAVQLRTEHVCRVFDVGQTDTGAPYMVMELLDGNDLGRAIARQPLPVTIAVEYVLQACVAVAEAHAAGIIHRDLKPGNLIVTRRPDGAPLVKVLDFGIAKAMTEAGAGLTRSQSMLGSPGYISPEQLQSARDVDVRTDVWALGATLYQLLSGRLPFHAQTATAMAVRIMTGPPDPLDIHPALGGVILRCLEKSPAQRYPDVAALAADLAPFGGPAGRAIAGMVLQLLRGGVARPPDPPPFAERAPLAERAPRRELAAAPDLPRITTTTDLAARARRRRLWLLAASITVLVSAAVAVIGSRRGAPSATAGSATAPAGETAAPTAAATGAAAIDAGAAAPSPLTAETTPSPLALADAGLPVPASGSARPPPAHTIDRAPRARDARAGSADARPDPRKEAADRTPGHESKPAVTGSVADTAREAKNTCLESAADTPFNTAMCWCTKKDKARAQAAYARLTGFKRASVRTWCAARGVELTP